MGFLSGSNGYLRFGKAGRVIPENNNGEGDYWNPDSPTRITNWTMNTAAQLLETTTLGDYDKSSVYGLRTTTGTLRLFYYTESTSQSGRVDNNSASWFFSALVRAETPQSADGALPPDPLSIQSIPVFLRLYVAKTQSINGDDYVEFTANLTGVSIASSVGELTALDVSYEATGQIARVRL